jgi:hypothetical protein
VSFGLMIESLVAILLLVTIGYCVILNARLKRLKADEQVLKATISELITATEIAGRAVAGLKATAQDADRTLGDRLRAAEKVSVDLDRQIRGGEAMLGLLGHGGSAPSALASGASRQRGHSAERAHSASEDARERAGDTRPEPASSARAVAAPSAPADWPDPKAVAAAAQAFADRARGRARDRAAGLAA